MTEVLVAIITKAHACQKDFGDEEDLSSLDGTSESDWVTIDTALDVVIGIANALGETFGQLWKIFEKPIMAFASGSEGYERSTAVGTIAECIKAMGASVTPFTSQLLKLLLHRMSDEDSEAKSNAAYGIGLLQEGSKNDKEILKAFPTILSKLEPLLQTDEARAKDNAAGCVSRMIMRHPSNIPVEQVLPALLDILPLKNDYDENVPVYDMIVKLCKPSSLPLFLFRFPFPHHPHSPHSQTCSHNPLTSPSFKNKTDQQSNPTMISLTPTLLPILAEAMAPTPAGQLKDATREKLTELVKFLATKQPAEVRKYEGLAALV